MKGLNAKGLLAKGLLSTRLCATGLAIALSALTSITFAKPTHAFYWPEDAQPNNSLYDDAWSFTCTWDCGIASFESEYGGHTVHGYSSPSLIPYRHQKQKPKNGPTMIFGSLLVVMAFPLIFPAPFALTLHFCMVLAHGNIFPVYTGTIPMMP